MANIGEAVVRILGDSSPFRRTLSDLDRTAGRGLDRVGRNIGESLGNAAGRALRIGLTTAAAGAAAAVGATLVKGFRRFADLEDATAALTITLGDAGKAAEFLGEVLEVVEGTPFSLDQFATVAKNLVAMQIEASKVPRILTAIGEAGAATGKGAEGVNTVANAIGRMATGAKLSLEPIRALEDQGIPALTILANKFGVTTSRMAKDISSGAIDSTQAIDLLTDGILHGTTGVSGLSVEAEQARENLASLGEAAETADERLGDLRDNVEDVSERIADLARDAQDAKDALADALRPASAREMESAILSVERSLNRQTDAAEELQDAQRDLNDALKETQRTADEIARGALDERRARLSVEDAIDRVQEAEEDLAKARKGGKAEDISDAERDLRSARLGVEESQLRLNDAEREAKELREGSPEQADKIAKAEKRVRDAQIAQREAAIGVAESQEDLNELRKKGTDQDEKVIDARRRVEDVTRSMVDAEKDLVKAQKAVIEGEEDVVDAHKKVADVQKEINKLGVETNKSTVALGGSMDLLGKTLRGALANADAAVARFGERIFTAFSKAGGDGNALAKVFISLEQIIDGVGTRVGEFAAKVANSEGFAKVLKFFEQLSGSVKDLEGKSFSEAFKGFVEKIDFGSLASKVIDGFFNALNKVPITKFSGAFTSIVLQTLATSTAAIVEGVIRIAPKIALGIVAGFLHALAAHPIKTTAFIGALGLPLIGPAIIGFLSKLPFGGIVAPLFSGLGRAVSSGFALLGRTTLGTALGVFGLNLKAGLANVLRGLPGIITGALRSLPGLLARLLPAALVTGLRAAGTALVAAGTSAAAALVGAILTGIAAGFGINWLLDKINPGINHALGTFGLAIVDFFGRLPGYIGGALEAFVGFVIDFFRKLPGQILHELSSLPRALFEFGGLVLRRLREGAEERFGPVLDFFRSVPGRIKDLFTGGFDLLRKFGEDVWNGFVDGFKAAGRFLLNQLGPLLRLIPQSIKDFFEVRSPSKLMERIGLEVGEGLTRGITLSLQDAAEVARREVARVSAALVPTVKTTQFTASVRGSDGASILSSARQTAREVIQQVQGDTTIIVNEAETPLATARVIEARLAKALQR